MELIASSLSSSNAPYFSQPTSWSHFGISKPYHAQRLQPQNATPHNTACSTPMPHPRRRTQGRQRIAVATSLGWQVHLSRRFQRPLSERLVAIAHLVAATKVAAVVVAKATVKVRLFIALDHKLLNM